LFFCTEKRLVFLAERVPRRLKRFQRGGETLEDWGSTEPEKRAVKQGSKKGEVSKEIMTQLALDEVQKFKQQYQRMPKKKEYDSIAESIYAQLKDKEQRKKIMERLERKSQGSASPSERARQRKAGRNEGRQLGKRPGLGAKSEKEAAFAKMQSAAKGLDEKEIEGLSVEDIFGEKGKAEKFGEKGKPGKKPEDGFDLGKGPAEEFGLGELENFGEDPEAEQKCPTCKLPAEDIIFCPECGTAFCKKCAKRVENLGSTKVFVCPDCGEKIKR